MTTPLQRNEQKKKGATERIEQSISFQIVLSVETCTVPESRLGREGKEMSVFNIESVRLRVIFCVVSF